MGILALSPISLDIIDPLAESFRDTELTDMVFSQFRDEPPADTNIVIVNFGLLDRGGIAAQIMNLNKYQPKVIGIDALFLSPRAPFLDSLLAISFAGTNNLVLNGKLVGFNEEKQVFDTVEYPLPIFSQYASIAHVNLITGAKFQDDVKICRTLNPFAALANGDTLLPFSVKLAQIYNPKLAKKFLDRGNEVEIINYRGNIADFSGNTNIQGRFTVLDVQDVLDENFDPSLIKDKIVMIGFLGNDLGAHSWEDKFYTPLNPIYAGRANPDMFGLVVHANAVAMILNEDYIEKTPEYVAYLLAFVVCFFNVALFMWINKNYDKFYDAVTRGLQVVEVIVLLMIPIFVFKFYDLKIDLTITTVTVVLVGDFLEIYLGFIRNLIFATQKIVLTTSKRILSKQ